jgi:hypothetical protein
MVEDQNGAEEMSRRSGKWEVGSMRSWQWAEGEVEKSGKSGKRAAESEGWGKWGVGSEGGGGASEMGSVGLSLHSCSLGTSRSVHSLQILLVEVLKKIMTADDNS